MMLTIYRSIGQSSTRGHGLQKDIKKLSAMCGKIRSLEAWWPDMKEVLVQHGIRMPKKAKRGLSRGQALGLEVVLLSV